MKAKDLPPVRASWLTLCRRLLLPVVLHHFRQFAFPFVSRSTQNARNGNHDPQEVRRNDGLHLQRSARFRPELQLGRYRAGNARRFPDDRDAGEAAVRSDQGGHSHDRQDRASVRQYDDGAGRLRRPGATRSARPRERHGRGASGIVRDGTVFCASRQLPVGRRRRSGDVLAVMNSAFWLNLFLPVLLRLIRQLGEEALVRVKVQCNDCLMQKSLKAESDDTLA